MQKYAVEIPEGDVKVAEDAKVTASCARCRVPLEVDANVPKCPRCGTEPAETGEQ